jgi:hypothetical protein
MFLIFGDFSFQKFIKFVIENFQYFFATGQELAHKKG